MSTMKSQEASSSTSRFTFDVFISFRGEDTRKSFTDHLYASLVRAGFRSFRDDDELEEGECIKFALEQAIRESRISIIVFSKGYALSTWCLRELVMILKRRTFGHVVLPVFYDVHPFEVRTQSGSLAEAFARHEKKLKLEKGERQEELIKELKTWRAALREVADLAGMYFPCPADGHEARFIQKIIEVVGDQLSRTILESDPHLGGIHSQGEGSVNPKTVEPLNCISPNGEFKRNIKYWQKGKFLGSGSFGAVYEGLTDDGFLFAVKEVSLLDQGRRGKQSIFQLEQEISLLSQFEHENIVRYFGRDKDDGKLYIFLELVTKGSLSNLYQKYNLGDSQVSDYTRQILNGLNYLHCRNVVHRDIKCANILVDASGSVKLADFGLAKVTKLNDLKSLQGTAFWMAPEVVNQKKHQGYGLAADIWSLGCTVLEMLTREIPYSPLEWMQALFQIAKGELPHIPTSLSIDARDFIFKCLQVNPDDRPTAAQLLDHPFVKL